MTDYYGSKVGAVRQTATNRTPIPNHLVGGIQQVLVRDTIELDAAVAQNDRVSLGLFPSTAIIDPVQSVIWFDDLGTSITLDVGDATDEDALVAAQDVATAAGSCLFLKSVDVANYFKPLWEQLGLAADPGGTIELFAKLEGGNPGTGTITWQVIGLKGH